MARQRLSTKKNLTPAQKYERLDRQYSDFTGGAISIHHAWLGFIVEQRSKGNSKATIDYYNRFYKKLQAYIEQTGEPTTECPVEFLENDVCRLGFIASLGNVNQQTINSYLRGFRSFGNWCEEQGYHRKRFVQEC